jgi:hypothetical protein
MRSSPGNSDPLMFDDRGAKYFTIIAKPEPGRGWRDERAAIDVPYPTQLEAIKEITAPASQLTSARRGAPLPL